MRWHIVVSLMIIEFLALFDLKMINAWTRYIARTFDTANLFRVYLVLAYLVFGIALSIVDRWARQRDKRISWCLLFLNILIFIVVYFMELKFAILPLILIGFFASAILSKTKE